MNTLSIKPEIIRWARLRAGLEIEELLNLFPKFADWENGQASPTLNQLEKLARKVCAPLGYFFLPQPPEEKLPIADFRSMDNTPVIEPSPDLLETIFSMQRRQAWYREFIIEEGASPLTFIGSVSLHDKPEVVAAKMRETLDITSGWIKSLPKWSDAFNGVWQKSERLGILIVCNGIVGNNTNRILDVNEFRGFVLSDAFAPLVFINNADAKAAQMFTLIHELVHLWINAAGVLNFKEMAPTDNETELFCNAVAAEFLVPKDELAAAWRAEKSFYTLATWFKVSPLVVARRALDLALIKKSDFFGFYNTYMGKVRSDKAAREGGNFYSNCDYRVGRPFTAAVDRATKSGRLLYRDAYNLTGLHGATFDKYVQKVTREGG
jgi:Zn-dependent peptidase ImmA (M78 family)